MVQAQIEVSYVERPVDQLANWHQAVQLIARMIKREIDQVEPISDHLDHVTEPIL